MDQIRPRRTGKFGHITGASKQPAIDIGHGIGPTRQISSCTVVDLCIHRPEHFPQHIVGVVGPAVAHLLNGFGEEPVTIENVGILGKEAEDQPSHELVHVMPAFCCCPILVML